MTDDQIRSVVDGVIREQLDGHAIDRIETRWGEDFDDDHVLTIDVVIKDDISGYDGARLLSIGRLLKNALRPAPILAFPLVRYLSQSEARELAA